MTPDDPDSAATPHVRPPNPARSGVPGGRAGGTPHGGRSVAPEDVPAPDASLTLRALAGIVDLALAVGLVVGQRRLLPGPSPSAEPESLLAWLATTVLPAWFALAVAEALPGRAGPGKRLLGLRIVSAHSRLELTFARLALRTALKLVPAACAAVALAYPTLWDGHAPLGGRRLALFLAANLWIGIYLAAAAMTRRRQSLHDLATGTRVTRRGSGAPRS